MRELEEEIADLRRAGEEKEDQRNKGEETMKKLKSEKETAERERDQNAKELSAKKKAMTYLDEEIKTLRRRLDEAVRDREDANRDRTKAMTEMKRGMENANKVVARQKKNTDTANNTINEMVQERKVNQQTMERDKEVIEDLERRLAGSERSAEAANKTVKEMAREREIDQREKEKLKGRIKSLEEKFTETQERFAVEYQEFQRERFRAGRAFTAKGAVEEPKESTEPPEETRHEVVEVDYNDTTDEGQAEGEFFFSPSSTPGTEGGGEATETAGDPEPGLRSSSSSSTVWDGNQWKDPEEGRPTPEGETQEDKGSDTNPPDREVVTGEEPTSDRDQEGIQEGAREGNLEEPEGEKEQVGRGHRTRRAARVQELSPMAKAQPKKSRKSTAGKKGRESGAK